jgi:2-dehydropantoate 2-reductase
MEQKKILIYGAGVIGSIYAGKFALAGFDVTVLARNARLKELQEKGLCIKNNKEERIEIPKIKTISELNENDIYDFIFVNLHKDQVKNILPSLQKNGSQNIVFMVNTSSGYDEWISSVGKSRVIPAFPGAGGLLKDGVVYYQITSKLVQPTTLGEIGGAKTPRLKALSAILEKSGFPIEISGNMDGWQKTHVAMMCPLVNVVFYDGGTNYSVAKNPEAINQMNLALKEGFRFLKESGIGIVPSKLSFLLYCPIWILNRMIKLAYNTKWAETVISTPALASPHDYEMMSADFVKFAAEKNYDLVEFKKLMHPQNKK